MAKPVEFGDTIFEGSITPETSIMEPVRDQSGEYLANGLSQAASDIGSIFGAKLKGDKDAANNGILNNYRQDITLLADAVDQNGLSLTAARSRMRQKYSEYIADNPHLSADIDKLNSTLLSENGIGHVIQTGNEQTQRELKAANEAYGAGWVDANGDPDVAGFQNYQNVVRTEEGIQRSIATRAAQRGEVTALEKEQLQGSIARMAVAGMPWVDQQISRAAALVDGGSDPAEILIKLKADVGKVTGEFTTSSQGQDISYIIEPINQRIAVFEDMVMGTTDTAVANAKIAQIKAKGDYAARLDPELGSLLALSELFGNNAGPFLQSQLTIKSVETMTKLLYPSAEDSPSRTPPDLIGQEKDVNSALSSVKDMLNTAANDKTPEVTSDVQNVLTNTLKSIGKYNADSVKDYRAVIDFLADPAVEKWVGDGSLIIPKGVSEKALRAVQDQYESVLLPTVEDVWTEGTVTVSNPDKGIIAEPMSLSEVIEPVWNGTSVSFQPIAEYANNPVVVGRAKTLNEGKDSIASPLNTLIRANAHMKGGNDYKAEWEVYGPKLFDTNKDFEQQGNEPVKIDDFAGGYEEPITNKEQAVQNPNAEGLHKFLAKGRPASYIDDLDPELSGGLSNMIAEMPPEISKGFMIASGARSNERQAELFNEAVKKYGSEAKARKWVAPPGKSKHNHGQAADLSYASPAVKKWVHSNAKKYGLTFPLSHEPWHIEPIGSR